MLTFGAVLVLGNAYLHTSALTQALLKNFNWQLSDHPPDSSDFTLRDLFIYLKKWFLMTVL
jgi:hypothetical protein